jgi:hypothetical protein
LVETDKFLCKHPLQVAVPTGAMTAGGADDFVATKKQSDDFAE